MIRMDNLRCIVFLLFVTVPLSDALNCYRCSHMSNVEINTNPATSAVVDYIKQYTEPKDPDCLQRVWSSDTPKQPQICPIRIYQNRNISPQCAGVDMRATLTFSTNMTGELVNVETSFRWRYRDCYFDVESPLLADGCHDMQDYNRFVKNSFLSLLSAATGTPNKDINGYICVCDDNKCNLKLPDQEPRPVGTGSSVSAQMVLMMVLFFLCYT